VPTGGAKAEAEEAVFLGAIDDLELLAEAAVRDN
jgi:hypothetical protein